MTQGSDLSSAFASELQAIPSGQPNAAMNVLNKHYNAAKDGATRDAIERTWKDFMSHYDGAAITRGDLGRRRCHDAPWTDLRGEFQRERRGFSDPNKIAVGQELSLPGGGTHTVASGETLSGIASQYSGGSSLAAERGGTEPTGGNYSSGGDLKVSEGQPSSSSSAPLPPQKPSEYGGSGGNSETGSGGMGKISPLASEGGGASQTGGSYSSGGDLKTGEGWPSGSSSAYPTGGAPSGGSGSGLSPLASSGGSGGTTSEELHLLASEGGSGGTTSDAKPRGGGRAERGEEWASSAV